ncbi:hypothetical protein [Flavobacterium solisilvae]|uniref:Uncharacterized protein n=1 Tax=Flavobacterium solisilvae TaxID=1852019 RepID=A0ABX1QUM3_9FLAO|nr:hypothetical protein [Flavobacterium solisilvae]NMH25971.1 hypothetical protein [Flavobacterium solisilvae]
MDKVKQILESEFNTFLSRMPERENKSANGMQKRLGFVLDNQEEFRKILNSIGNDFLVENQLNENEKLELEILIKKYFEKYLKSFSSN